MAALLRGINVGGHRLVPMIALREVAQDVGLREVETYIQSGNVVFETEISDNEAARALEEAIAARFGFHVDVVVFTQARWKRLKSSCPFPLAAQERPNLLHACVFQGRPRPGVIEALARYASPGEKTAMAGGALWIDYAERVARSKLTPAVLDRAVGSPVTARNWKTVLQIATMLG